MPSDRRLENRVCVITGTASGTGYAAALLFAEHGAVVVGVDIDGDRGRACAQKITHDGGRATFIEGDVSLPMVSAAVAEHCDRNHGGCDVVFNNAAELLPDAVNTVDIEQFNRVFAVNVAGPLLLSAALAPLLASSGRGSIVNHGSIDGAYGNPRLASYSASKAALNSVTRLMAHTYGAQGIRVNAIGSGYIDQTRSGGRRRANDPGEPDAQLRERLMRRIAETTPGGRLGTYEDAAAVALFLASDDAHFINGASIPVTGGRGVITPGTGEA